MQPVLRCAFLGLAIALAMSIGALASPITYNQLFFTTPVLSFGSATDVLALPSSITGGYSFSGEFCVNEGCSTGPVATTATSLLRLTNLSLTCSSGDNCAPVDVGFEAQGASAPAGAADVSVTLIGDGSATGFARVCVADSNHLCTADLFGTQSFSFSYVSAISGSAQGTITTPGAFNLFGNFHVDGLASGSSVMLTNSLDIGLTSRSQGGAVPEPSALFLLPAGLAALALLRRRKSQAPGMR
ncbi:MAG TPA: PEP-CTERM sorting domain-containing protein [Bryobacteraceae bacterium]|nr:PEP-CTERM sorting domain-containing protein [Bryobacteraceae bacterium]